MVDIGTLTTLPSSEAVDVNDYAQAVGHAGTRRIVQGDRFFLYTPGLPLLWLSNLALGGWTIESAEAINEYGEVSGIVKRTGGVERARFTG